MDNNNLEQSSEPINWQVDHVIKQYSSTWYVGLGGAFLAMMFIAVILLESWSFAALLVAVLVSIIFYIKKPISNTKYSLSGSELFIDDNRYELNSFKAFGLIKNSNGLHNLILLPTKRFMPALTLDLPEAEGERVVDFFGARLPMQKLELNFIDKIVQKIGL